MSATFIVSRDSATILMQCPYDCNKHETIKVYWNSSGGVPGEGIDAEIA